MDRKMFSTYLPAFFFLCLCYVFLPESIDDAYITLRFSKNLMLGHGPVFNVGEHVEGYSNFLWMAVLALTGKLGISMPLAMKLGGIASGILTIVIAGKAAREWFNSKQAVAWVRILLATSSFLALWAADGLETSFYTMLITLLLYQTASKDTSAWLIGALAGLVALTRPEGVMYGLLVLIFVARTRSGTSALKVAAPWSVIVIGYELFRWFYFGEWVSNTALAKVHASFDTVFYGLKYFWAFNENSGYLVLPAAAIGAIANMERPGVLLASIFVCGQLVFLAVSGGDFMFGYRFVVPIIPCIALLVIGTATQIASRSPRSAIFFFLSIVATSGYAQYSSLPLKHVALDNFWYRDSPHFEIAKFIDHITSPSDTVLLSEAGIIPFGIHARVDDYLGLTSAYWYVHERGGGTDLAHLMANKPKVIVLSFLTDTFGTTAPRMAVERNIIESSEFQSLYIPVKRFDIDPSSSFLNYIYYYYTPSASVIFFEVFQRKPSS